MAKIILVRNKFRKEIPLGLIALKSYLDQTTHQSLIYDLCTDKNSLESLEEIISLQDINFLGLSVGSMTYKEDLKLMERLKSIKDIRVIVGGAFANATELFEHYADSIIYGRGEEKLLNLLDNFEGIRSKRPSKNKINTNLVRFEDYEYPRDNIGNKEFPLYTSMGCKFRCLYCSIPQMNDFKIWYKEPKIICEELQELVEKGVNHIRFVDDLFGINYERTRDLLRDIKRINGIKGIYAQLRIDYTNNELLEEMRSANFSGIYFGIESSNEDTLKKIGKFYDRNKIIDVLNQSKKLGFNMTGAFTIGYPWETRLDIQKTLEFAKDMQEKYSLRPSVYIVTPFPGTPLSRQIELSMIKIKDYSLWDAKHAVMDTVNLTLKEIQGLYDDFISS